MNNKNLHLPTPIGAPGPTVIDRGSPFSCFPAVHGSNGKPYYVYEPQRPTLHVPLEYFGFQQ